MAELVDHVGRALPSLSFRAGFAREMPAANQKPKPSSQNVFCATDGSLTAFFAGRSARATRACARIRLPLMSDRTFTLDEAQSLLPVLESLLRTAMAGKKLMEEVDAEMQEVGHRIFLNGGTHLNIVPLARRKAERAKAEQRVRDTFAEIGSIGVQVKDLDIGLLDFPCTVEGR